MATLRSGRQAPFRSPPMLIRVLTPVPQDMLGPLHFHYGHAFREIRKS
jgi:hypothetical protein